MITNDAVLGLALGVLLGYLEAFNINILLARAPTWRSSFADTLKTTGQLLAVPGFVFGGPWLSAQILSWLTPADFASPYAIACVAIFIFGTHRAWRNIATAAAVAWEQPRRRRA
jgi:hypothetical protein